MGRRKTPWLDRIVAALLCKSSRDLSEEVGDAAEPCTIKELFRFASRRERVLYGIGVACAGSCGALMPLVHVFSGMIANVYLTAKEKPVGNEASFDAVISILVIYAISESTQFLLSFAQQYLLLSGTTSLVERLRREFLSATLRREAAALDATSAGEMSSLLNENIDKIRDALGEKVGMVVRGLFMYFASMGVSFYFNWKVTLCLLPLGPLCAITMGLMGKYSTTPLRLQMEAAASAADVVQKSIMNVQTVAACNGQEDMVKRYSSHLTRAADSGTKVALLSGFFEGAFFFVLYLFSIGSILVGVPDAHAGGSEAGSVLIAFGCILIGSYYLGMVGPYMMSLLKARIAAALIYRTIDEVPPAREVLEKVEKLRGDIVFDAVHFKYPTRETPVLNALSLSAGAGQTIALAGHSGCGKTTTIGLLSKMYDSMEGTITIDGKDIKSIDKNVLRRNMGIVSQEPCLFHGTVRENIKLGREWIGEGTEDERIEKVLEIAQAKQFVTKLEKGVETLLGEGGVALSGGQKQRVAIARAIFCDPAILILDEATSALDVHSEAAVQEALNGASIGRTTVIIAHRLSTLKSADVIYVLDEGKTVEKGSHEELLALGGIYSRMADRQSLCGDEEKTRTAREEEKHSDFSLSRHASMRASIRANGEKVEEEESWESSSSFARLYTHGRNGQLILTVIFSVFRGFELPYYVALMGVLYSALHADPADVSWWLAVFSISCVVIGLAVWIALTAAFYFGGRCSEGIMAIVREQILRKILNRDAAFFDRPETSNATIVGNINQQAEALMAGLDHRFVLFVWSGAAFITCLGYALFAKWQIGLFAIGSSLVFFFILFSLFRVLSAFLERSQRLSRTAQIALEMLEYVRTIQLMAVEGYFEGKYAKALEEVRDLQGKVILTQSLSYAVTKAVAFFFGLLAFYTGAYYAFHGEVDPLHLYLVGISIEFAGCCITYVQPFFPDFARANAAARILYSYFDLPDLQDEGDDERKITGEISVEGVSFAYPMRPEHKVANRLNISAAVGESIALVGASGCGKSTLIALIQRFYSQRGGQIKVDGVDHRRFTLRNLRSQIGLVGQEPTLFQGTISSNILLGCGDKTMDDVRAACKMANAADFIESLPEGYETEVGSAGRSLSGGQKQRIAIARALVRRPRLLLLDEATSALDGESERVVQEALAKASEGRTSITIAHRLSSIKDATRIYFIEEGRVVESGRHEELIERGERYASYVKAQTLH